jgi:3-phenylpropionate/trans-cinnamate dioxygenase ferredoxin reductase subunit
MLAPSRLAPPERRTPMFFDTRPRFTVTVEQTGESYACATTESLLQGMLRLGRRGIPVGCVNGGCGVCKVQILEGEVSPLGPVSRAHVSAEEEARGCTLACRVAPRTVVRLAVTGRFEKPFQKGFARAADRVSTL